MVSIGLGKTDQDRCLDLTREDSLEEEEIWTG